MNRSTSRFHPLALGVFVAGVVLMASVSAWNRIHGLDRKPRATLSAVRAHDSGSAVVTVPPLAWAVRGLLPQGARVQTLVPQGAGCEGVELTPGQMAAVRSAGLVVSVGLGLDDQVARLVEGDGEARLHVSFADLLSHGASHAHNHDHDDAHAHEDEHSHAQYGADPHLWLDPELMKRLVMALAERLGSGASETESERLRAAAGVLAEECDRIDREYRERLATVATRKLVTYHDAYGRLAQRYGLEVAAVIQHTHDAEPSPGDLARAASAVRDSGLAAIFVEPQFPQGAARRIAEETGAQVLVLDPLGDGDWPAMMRRNLDALAQGLAAAPR